MKDFTTCPGITVDSMDQVVLDLAESIAMQETALRHNNSPAGQKLQLAIQLDGMDLCKLLEVNDSATNMVHAVANLELILKDKLEFVANSFPYGSGDGGEETPVR